MKVFPSMELMYMRHIFFAIANFTSQDSKQITLHPDWRADAAQATFHNR